MTANRPAPEPNAPAAEPLPAESSTLSPDEVFHILQTSRRRESIRYLLREDGPTKMSDVAEQVAAREHDTTAADLTSKQRQRVYIPLYQSHLPKLDTAGVIEYDKPRGIVRPTDRLEQFRPYLEAAKRPTNGASDGGVETNPAERRERRHYATAIAVCGGLLLAAALRAVEPSSVALGATVAIAFALTMVVGALTRSS